MQIAQGHRLSQRCNQGARLRLFSPTPVPCYCTTPYHANGYGSDNKEIPCPVGLPSITLPLLALYRALLTYLPLLGNSAIGQGLPGASQPAPCPGQTAVPGHPHGCSPHRDNQATALLGTAPWGRISWDTELLRRAESAPALPHEDPGMDIMKHDVSTQRK